jgi:hypothetical protein
VVEEALGGAETYVVVEGLEFALFSALLTSAPTAAPSINETVYYSVSPKKAKYGKTHT